jgi:sugar/nucleoside kinase (ribokinase family)
VELFGPVVDGGTGTVVSVATPDGRRSMLSDRGVSPQLDPDELDGAWFDGCDWLHVPGYSLVREPIAEAARRAAEHVAHVSVDASSTAAVTAFGADAFVERVNALAPETVFANEDEAALLGELQVETLVVKRGERGCLVRRGDALEEHAAPRVEAVDTTGAGDAFAAGFLVGGPELALEAAARCVGTMGAMP